MILNMKYRLSVLTVISAFALQAQMQMNVQQLADFIRSELALKQHSDKQIAAYVKKIQLSERLTDKTITDLEAQQLGPKTEEALKTLRDQSASIKRTASPDATYSPATAPDTTLTAAPPTASIGVQAVQPPPPDSVHQQQILDLMRQYAMTYAQNLPNYICVRVDRRYVDPRGGDSYRSLGTVLAKVSYVQGQEQYKVYSNAGRIVDPDMGGIGGGGARSSGEFAGMMRSLFEPKSQADFGWDHWARLRGRTMAVFNYFIDSGHSSYSISYGEGREDDQRIITAYKGLVYADANTGEIDRITFNAVDVPSSFPVRTAHELVDYDLVNIGDQEQAVLPLRAMLNMSTLRDGTSKNDIEFRNYHKYGSNSIIKYDMDPNAALPERLPDSKTQEQPLTT
ncbi:MAG: hypothetical protein M3Y24_13290, partial [Acidobacteriota bacterium]|nr:hypothetical protein [Acidobacteriota bacterium]